MPSLHALLAVWSVIAVGSPTPPATPPLPTVDPQARQVLADMVNMYNGFSKSSPVEYEDVETIQATGDTKVVSPQYLNSRFTVALSSGSGCLLTATTHPARK